MQLHPLTPFPITTAPGFEAFADDIIRLGGGETVVWTTSVGDVIDLPAIVHQGAGEPATSFGTTLKVSLTAILVSAQQVQGILDGDLFRVRGGDFRIADGGIEPDGNAMVRIVLSEVVT